MPKVEENALNDYEQEKLVFSYVDITMYRKVKHSLDCLCACNHSIFRLDISC